MTCVPSLKLDAVGVERGSTATSPGVHQHAIHRHSNTVSSDGSYTNDGQSGVASGFSDKLNGKEMRNSLS